MESFRLAGNKPKTSKVHLPIIPLTGSSDRSVDCDLGTCLVTFGWNDMNMNMDIYSVKHAKTIKSKLSSEAMPILEGKKQMLTVDDDLTVSTRTNPNTLS